MATEMRARSTVQHGYTYRPHHMSSVAFFPVYPLATRAVGTILPGGDTLAALVVTAVSGLDAFLLLRRWCATRLDASETRGTLVALALYPFSWFLFGAA